MSIAFLNCDYIRARHNCGIKCCEECHSKEGLIYVRPEHPEGGPDWFLCIEAIVCCNLYHFARSISREWWETEASKLGVKRYDGRGYIFPGEGQSRPKPDTKKSRVVKRASDGERSLEEFLNAK